MAAWRRILGVLRASPDGGDPLPDGELLARFAASRDQAAFELLVWRHAAMVFGVCRRALRDEHLAEDAFQAVFLVLARKAGAVRTANLAGWLFRVARRVSARAAKRVTVTQMIAVEPPSPALPDRLEQDELRELLDAEIARLPERFRLPVLLCYLGGQSTEDAARQLGVPRGTILSRLSAARERLAGRLTRRGVTVPAVAVATPNLVHTTVSAAVAFAARLPELTTRSALVAEGVLRTMTLHKLVPVAALFVVTGLVSGYGLGPGPGVAPAAALQPQKPAANPPTSPPTVLTPEQKARDDEYARLKAMIEKLAAQIEAEERSIRTQQELNAAYSLRGIPRAEKQIDLLDAELFTAEREIAELNARRDLLREKLAASAEVPNDARVVALVEKDARVTPLAAAVINAAQKLEGLKEKVGPMSPALQEAEKSLEQMKKSLTEMRVKVREEQKETMQAESRRTLVARLAEVEEKVIVGGRVLEARKKLRDNLEKHISRTGAVTIDYNAQIEGLKPKKELLAKLQTRLVTWEVDGASPPKPAPPAGVEAKLDVLLREVEALRKDVSELKKR